MFLPSSASGLTHVERLPPRPGTTVEWPAWVPDRLRTAYRDSRGVTLPWAHQVAAASAARSGTHTVVATGTGSGKSLAYQLPSLAALLDEPNATVLYVSPTKALAADQLRNLAALDLPAIRPATYDGDTSREERDWVRQHARIVLTNPDMLHFGILPGHAAWSRFLRGLRFVVVDECHAYRGLFGSHVAHILRRLRRIASRYRSTPTFILASATAGDPQQSGSRLTGLPMTAFTEDTSPRGGVTFALWEPPLLTAAPNVGSAPRHSHAAPFDFTAAPHQPVPVDVAVGQRHAPPVDSPRDTPRHTAAKSPPAAPAQSRHATSAEPPHDAAPHVAVKPPHARSRQAIPVKSPRDAPPHLADEPRHAVPIEPPRGATVEPPRGATAHAAVEPPPGATAHAAVEPPPGATAHAAVEPPPGAAVESTRGAAVESLVAAAHEGPFDAAPVRRSALRETADLLTAAVLDGQRTLAFVRSRKGAEVVAAMARRSLEAAVPGLGSRVAAYRAGFLREERRALERDLMDGNLLALASTNALELGVDLVGLDAVIIAGYPGTLASLWQQAGRAGRAGRDATCVFVARDDPLDTYLVHHPEALFGRPVEATVLDPANPHVLAPQLCCAAAEMPITDAELPMFGPSAGATLDALVAAGVLRRRPGGWYWTSRDRPDVDLRGTGGGPVAVVESSTGRLLGTVDTGSAHHQVHTGAVHLHQGSSYVVDKLDLADSVALVHAEDADYSTHPRDVTSLTVLAVRQSLVAGPVTLSLGEVEVTSQVVSFQRRRLATGEVIATCQLDLPERILRTVAVWWTVTPAALDDAGVAEVDWPGALHAAEHASIGLLPLVATCDRWDIGGLSTALHADTALPTVFVYDGHPGGAGFAERAFEVAGSWLGATRDLVASCRCESGCPSCVQSPKCGNGNNPLHKTDAVRVLSLVLSALAAG